ncbi:MAG: hypothetical protein LC751_18345 [Actinobacteria bacterium]|nr:hypothetical protein [Actinomycetota bacterium]MCA1740548.1 hypothetical protein [Actinomycetota bacterium]
MLLTVSHESRLTSFASGLTAPDPGVMNTLPPTLGEEDGFVRRKKGRPTIGKDPKTSRLLPDLVLIIDSSESS